MKFFVQLFVMVVSVLLISFASASAIIGRVDRAHRNDNYAMTRIIELEHQLSTLRERVQKLEEKDKLK